jgi:hypothetical protein
MPQTIRAKLVINKKAAIVISAVILMTPVAHAKQSICHLNGIPLKSCQRFVEKQSNGLIEERLETKKEIWTIKRRIKESDAKILTIYVGDNGRLKPFPTEAAGKYRQEGNKIKVEFAYPQTGRRGLLSYTI